MSLELFTLNGILLYKTSFSCFFSSHAENNAYFIQTCSINKEAMYTVFSISLSGHLYLLKFSKTKKKSHLYKVQKVSVKMLEIYFRCQVILPKNC